MTEKPDCLHSEAVSIPLGEKANCKNKATCKVTIWTTERIGICQYKRAKPIMTVEMCDECASKYKGDIGVTIEKLV